MGTVVLWRVFHRSQVLGLINADLVLVHAIYVKALKRKSIERETL